MWLASGFALALAMRHGIQSAHAAGAQHAKPGSAISFMAAGCLVFTLLQLASLFLFAFVFRAAWRLRSAVCFSLAAGLVILGDAAGLLALLVWLGITLGAR